MSPGSFEYSSASPVNSPRTTAQYNSTMLSHLHVIDDSDADDGIGHVVDDSESDDGSGYVVDDSDSDDSIGPVELPDGRLVCRPHGLTFCPYCCVDFSFMEELLEDPEERLERETNELYEQLSDEMQADIDARWGSPRRLADGPAYHGNNGTKTGFHIIDTAASSEPCGRTIRRGTGRVFPTKFNPPSATSAPGVLFPAGIGHQAIPPVARFIRRDDSEQLLIYADGACLNNGQPNPKAGWAFVFKPDTNQPSGIVSARLEKKGPFGDAFAQTSNRAELRAVLAALRFRHWRGGGFSTLVFATDSEYVAEGATSWIRGWVRNGWKTSTGADVKNKDMWEVLLGEVER
ncbi:ribonuclease H domain-containing protein [Pochonia chlamydosporia 170]|uniref:ribonuclease H n=1 Tax=Pochonia chlamydosporia 170 TaxID=1380566 RepID=A0A179EVH5_METCM|nr:ribonuclease H domain-containing protein [Pochonia chlamydosporia 170]OAQ57224.2 ribonuclease H domain-containing protein [Pochonia chlamydosporia 170]